MNIESTLKGQFWRLSIALLTVLLTTESSVWAQTSHSDFMPYRDFSRHPTARWVEPGSAGDAEVAKDKVSQDEELAYGYYEEKPTQRIGTPTPAVTDAVLAEPAKILDEEPQRVSPAKSQTLRLAVTSEAHSSPNGNWPDGEIESFVPCEEFPYRWAVRADAIFLDRSTADGRQSLVFGNPADPRGTELLNTSQLDFSTSWGQRVSVVRNFECCAQSIEFSYFGMETWNAVQQRAGAINVQFPSLAHPPLPAGAVTFEYGSDLHNTEVNLRHRVDDGWLSLILGFRYLELSEDFGAVFSTGGSTSFYNINTNNHLVGFQVGGEADIWQRGDWLVSGWAKAAVFSNSADHSTFQNLAAIGGGTSAVGARGNDTTYLGELGFNVLFQLTDRLAARAGYQFLWMDRLALAPEQLDNTNPAIPLATLDHNGDLFIHGGFFGFEGVF